MTLSKLPGGRNTAVNAVVYRVNVAKSCALLEQRIKAYNEQHSERKHRLKAVHYALAKKLLELYAGTFWDWQVKHYFSFNPYIPLPYLSINNVTLGDWMVCTDRSIRNYRDKLEALGFIVETVSHGTKRNFELRINPAFIHMAVNTTTERVALPEVQSFPQTGSGYPQLEQTGTVSGKEREPAPPVVEQELNVESVQEPQEPGNRNERREQKTPCGGTGTPTGTPPSCAAPPAPSPENVEQRRAGRALMQYALPVLYPQRRYWNAEEKGRIEAQAERLFESVTELNINKVIDNYCLRVLMAAHHYQKHTGVPLPAPDVFFNPDCEFGFRITRYWPQYPEKFPVVRSTRSIPKVRKRKDQTGRTGQIEIGQLGLQLAQNFGL